MEPETVDRINEAIEHTFTSGGSRWYPQYVAPPIIVKDRILSLIYGPGKACGTFRDEVFTPSFIPPDPTRPTLSLIPAGHCIDCFDPDKQDYDLDVCSDADLESILAQVAHIEHLVSIYHGILDRWREEGKPTRHLSTDHVWYQSGYRTIRTYESTHHPRVHTCPSEE